MCFVFAWAWSGLLLSTHEVNIISVNRNWNVQWCAAIRSLIFTRGFGPARNNLILIISSSHSSVFTLRSKGRSSYLLASLLLIILAEYIIVRFVFVGPGVSDLHVVWTNGTRRTKWRLVILFVLAAVDALGGLDELRNLKQLVFSLYFIEHVV